MTRRDRPRLAIVDPNCAFGYEPATLSAGALGGTEATVLRVSTALARQFDISLYQRNRMALSHCGGLSLYPVETLLKHAKADLIIVINAWKVALKLRRKNPDVPIFVWLHVFPGRHNRQMGKALHDADIGVICVSKSHADGLRCFMGDGPQPIVTHIYNPIDDALVPDATPRLNNRLLFASSPHKGLCEVFDCFSALRRDMPDLTLVVADPGYLRWDAGPVPDNVIPLGPLSHAALIRQMRRALCLFYSQTTFAETFGLVMAEANAVGTPVLAHKDLGANNEVLCTPGQCIDGADIAQAAERISSWRCEAPQVAVNEMFRLSNVAAHWADVLHGAAGSATRDSKAQVA